MVAQPLHAADLCDGQCGAEAVIDAQRMKTGDVAFIRQQRRDKRACGVAPRRVGGDVHVVQRQVEQKTVLHLCGFGN